MNKDFLSKKPVKIVGLALGASALALGAVFTHIHHNDSWYWNSKWPGFCLTLIGSSLFTASVISLKKIKFSI